MIVHKSENHAAVRAKVVEIAGSAILTEPVEDRNGLLLEIRAAAVFDFLRSIQQDPALRFEYFIDVTGIDYSDYSEPKPERFGLHYTVLSPLTGLRLQIGTYLPESHPQISSIAPIFAGANWCEREVFDMYGIRFSGHPDLKRILMPEDFDGYPLRKDYPLRGRGERASFPVYEATRGHDRNI
ncbi:MAG: NADH-quinone oxidoreductase subunit C [bacterium]|nr:NADH-quinone oxidoreductase subunit C [bacterium]